MVRYVINRILLLILVVVCASFLIFTIVYFVPGDPAMVLLGAEATPADLAAKRAELGIDQPYLVQLGNFMYNTFIKLDLGTSWVRGTSVMGGIIERLPRTFLLGFLTALVTVIVGVPLGVTAATHQGKWQDRGLIIFSMIFISIPEFWLALMLILLFSSTLGWLPSFGLESWTCYILPVISGALGCICNVARQGRASVLDVVHADYITTARAKGLKERAVQYGHMLPNALIPIITIVGNYFTRCIGGTLVIEKIFSFPGVGLYLNDAITARDYPVIRGCVIVISAFTAVMMLLVDLAYGFADPRIKAQYSESGKRKGKPKKEKNVSRRKREDTYYVEEEKGVPVESYFGWEDEDEADLEDYTGLESDNEVSRHDGDHQGMHSGDGHNRGHGRDHSGQADCDEDKEDPNWKDGENDGQ